jgi:uncharacterized repeat protein (TIGR01451 family)
MATSERSRIRVTFALTLLLCLLSHARSVSAQGLQWLQVSTQGFDAGENWWIGSLAVFEGLLYAGTWNPAGAEIWRSPDGLEWSRVVTAGLDSAQNQGAVSAITFDGSLYVGLYNTTSGATIWRSSDGANWAPVLDHGLDDASNGAVLSMAVLDQALYASTWNFSSGARVWRTTDGTDWLPVGEGGFGDAYNEEIPALIAFRSALYAGTLNQVSGAQVWRTSDGEEWKRVVPDGFADGDNVEINSLAIHRGILYAGTVLRAGGSAIWRTSDGLHWSRVDSWISTGELTYLLVHDGYLFAGASGERGAEVWSSRDGVQWSLRNAPGFGNANNASTHSAVAFNESLYVGTSNPGKGAEVYRTSGYGATVNVTAGAEAVCAGENQSFDVVVENSGQHPLTRITIQDDLPVLTEFIPGSSTPGGDQTSLTGSVTWNMGTLLPTESVSLHIELRVSTLADDETLITNRISIAAQEISPLEDEKQTVVTRCVAPSSGATAQTESSGASAPAVRTRTSAPTVAVSPSPEKSAASAARVSLGQAAAGSPVRLPMILKQFVP